MTTALCSVDGCGKPVRYVKEMLCNNHYRKFLKYGTATPTPDMKKKPGPAPNPDAPRSRHGEARQNEGKGRTYEHLVIGGTCKNGHILTEDNTHNNRHGNLACSVCRVNAFRRNKGRPEVSELKPSNRSKTHCSKGHPFDAANTYWTSKGSRACNTCRSLASRSNSVKKYGITLTDKHRMIDEQDGRCKICRNPFKNGRDTHVDHFHDDGTIRGILCGNCNNGLGNFRDNPEFLIAAAQYLLDADAFRLSTDSPQPQPQD